MIESLFVGLDAHSWENDISRPRLVAQRGVSHRQLSV